MVRVCMSCVRVQDRANARDTNKWATVPVYLNMQRKACLFSVLMQCPPDVNAHVWDERGVAITLWQSLL